MLEQEPGPQKPKRNWGLWSLNKMQEGIIKVMTQFSDGHPLNLKALIPNGAMTAVFLQGRSV
jgi:hypothetical protein